jgi:hypothetical protein
MASKPQNTTCPDGVSIWVPSTPASLLLDCAWGDDGSTLYITADMFLCRVKTATKGSTR